MLTYSTSWTYLRINNCDNNKCWCEMSRIPKYFRSDDFDAPQLYGDQWGYLNNVLRKCLVEGYNNRTDLTSYQVLTSRTVQFTYATPHNYSVDQVVQISTVGVADLEVECIVSSIVDANNIICEYFSDLFISIGTSATGLTGSSIVSPCGFREKFRSGDRSVYVIDQTQEDCFLVVDARTPSNWTTMVTGTTSPASIAPNVYMCDGMSDIDTITGSRIFPNDVLYPTRFNSEWSTGTSPRKGILNFISYYGITNNATSNVTATAQTTPCKWKLIGNGRWFWLITESIYYPDRVSIQAFGKFYNAYQNDADYFLLGTSLPSNVAQYDNTSYTNPATSYTNMISTYTQTTRYSSTYADMYTLSKGGSTTQLRFNNGYMPYLENLVTAGNNVVSGYNTNTYDNFSGKLKISDFTLMTRNNTSLVGYVPSVKYLGYSLKLLYGNVYKMKANSVKKRYVYITHTSTFNSTYLFSLDYQDWKNYD